MRAYNRGKPFHAYDYTGGMRYLRGISARDARKIQYDVPLFVMYDSDIGWRGPTNPRICRDNSFDYVKFALSIHSIGFAVEVDPPKPEYEPDAQ